MGENGSTGAAARALAGGDLDATTRMAKALSHPLRASILLHLNEAPASPVRLSRLLDAPVARIAYHVKLLEELECIELVELRPVRGSVEHIYRATRRVLFEEQGWGAPSASVGGQVVSTPLALDQAGWDHLAGRLEELVREAQDVSARGAGREVVHGSLVMARHAGGSAGAA